MIYKVIGAVIFIIIYYSICLDYMGFLQEILSKHDNNIENTRFKNFYGLVIPDILMSIMSCHGFSKSLISTVILTCRSALVFRGHYCNIQSGYSLNFKHIKKSLSQEMYMNSMY